MSDPRDDRAPADQERDRKGDPDESTKSRDVSGQDEDASVGTPHEDGSVDAPDDGLGETPGDSASGDRVRRDDESAGRGDRSLRDEQARREGDRGQSKRENDDDRPIRRDDHQPKPPRSNSSESRELPRSNSSDSRKPPQKRGETDTDSRLTRLLQYVFDIASSVVIVVLIGALLFATSGVWPPLVAIESPSMEPHIDTGELVFVMDEDRFAGSGAVGDSGVVPARAGEETGYRTFEGYGDVIIYEPDGNGEATPIIHRAMFWVEDGENWYDRADPDAIGGADDCDELANCPAPHAGFITKGDNTVSNKRYDQAMGISEPVKPEWVIGTAEYGVPGLGQIRLLSGEVRSSNVTTATNMTIPTSATNVSGEASLPAVTP